MALSTYARSLSNNHGKPSMLFSVSIMCLRKHQSLNLRTSYSCFHVDDKLSSQLLPLFLKSYIVFRSSLKAHGGFEHVLSKSGTLISQQPCHPKHKASLRHHESLRQNRSRPRQLLAFPQHRSQAHRKWYASRAPSQAYHPKKQRLLYPTPFLSSPELTSHHRRPRQPRRPRLALPSNNPKQGQSSTTHNPNTRHPLPATE